MGNPIGGGEEAGEFDTLVDEMYVVVFKTKVLHFKIENTPIKERNGKRNFKRVLRFLFVDKRELFAMKLSFEEFSLISFLKVFRYSFSQAIPIFFNRLNGGTFLVRSLKRISPVIGYGLKFVKM